MFRNDKKTAKGEERNNESFYLMDDQSTPAVQFVFFQVRTILGIIPSIVTLAS